MTDYKKHSLYRKMDVENVLTTVFNVYLKNFAVLFFSSLIAVFIVQVVVYQTGFMELYKNMDFYEIERNAVGILRYIGIILLVSLIVYSLVNVFIINYLYKKEFKPEWGAGDFFSDGSRKYFIHMFFFLILTTVIIVFGAMFGLIAIIIGALIVALYLGTALTPGGTIIVIEEKNAVEAIGRSFQLTHTDFWSSLGAVVLYILIMIVVSLVLAVVSSIPFIIVFFENIRSLEDFTELFNPANLEIGFWVVILNSITSALTYPLMAILSLVLYFKLRYTEDERIPEVID